MLPTIKHWLRILTALTEIAVILIPLLSFRRTDANVRGRSSGIATGLLRWPVMLALTIVYVAVGIALWRPPPIFLLPGTHLSVLVVGSLLYFPGIALYLWGHQTLGRMFGISSGFGASLYQNHRLIRSGPYRFMRHPMYLAVILAAFGALLIFRTWAMVLFSVSSLGVIFCARQEERLLAAEFGGGWEAYRRKVHGWFPTPRNRVK